MISTIVGLAILYKIYSLIPGLLPFFGISLTALFLSWISSQMFKKELELEEQTHLSNCSGGGVTS